MKKLSAKILTLTLILAALSANLTAQTRISFAKGRTSASVSGQIGGYGERSYVLSAKYGQVLSATVSSRNGCVKFNNGATSITYITKPGNNYLYLVNSCRNVTGLTLTVAINYGSD